MENRGFGQELRRQSRLAHIGGTNHLIDVQLAHTQYVRDREQEFTRKGVDRDELVTELENLIPMINGVLSNLDLEVEYPIMFDDSRRTNSYVLVRLLAHLNYHLGQVNYLRRVLDPVS